MRRLSLMMSIEIMEGREAADPSTPDLMGRVMRRLRDAGLGGLVADGVVALWSPVTLTETTAAQIISLLRPAVDGTQPTTSDRIS